LYLGRVVETHVDARYIGGRDVLSPIILISRRYAAAKHFVCDFGASAGNPPANALNGGHPETVAYAVTPQEHGK
jgi:hypothetical protein